MDMSVKPEIIQILCAKNICKNSSFWFCCGHCFRFDVEVCGAAERERNSYFYTIYIADMFSYCRTLTEVKFQMLLALIDVQHVFVCVCVLNEGQRSVESR